MAAAFVYLGSRFPAKQVLKFPGAHPNQQTSCEAAEAILDLAKPDSNLVVFGIGWDAVMWARMVPQGSVKYLEHHTNWRKLATELLEPEKNVEVLPIFYTSSVWRWSSQFIPLDPTPIKAHSSDITLVDSPEGFSFGRGPAILEAYRVTKPGGYIFLDDAKRIWERFLASSLLWPYCDCEMINTRGGFLKCKVLKVPAYALEE